MYSKLGVVKVTPSFQAETLTLRGVSEQVVSRELVKSALRVVMEHTTNP